MTWTVWPENASSGSPSYTAQIIRQQESVWHTPHPSTVSRPLGALSGRRPFAWLVTLSTLNIQIAAGSGVLDVETPVATGSYRVASDAQDTSLNVTAAHATLERIDGVYITVDDTDVDGSTFLKVLPTYLAGTPATAGTQVAPTTPARSMRIATIAVPHSGSGSPTVTMGSNFTVAAGGVLPAGTSADYPAGAYEGQYVDDWALDSLFRFNGSTFDRVSARTYESSVVNGTVIAVQTSVCSITLPAGNWVITFSGYFNYSTTTARLYEAQLWNSTDSSQVAAAFAFSGTLGQIPFSRTKTVTITGTKTFQVRVSTTVVDGTQLYAETSVVATAAGVLN